MNEKMLAWDDMQLFLSVARDGGLSAAARSTGRSAATLGRRMLALERIGFRNARPREAALAGRKVARVEFVPYGTRDAPDSWIRVMADTASARWLAKMVGDDAICEVTAPRNGPDLALQGVGLALLPSFIGDSQPGLQRRGHPVAELSHDQWIVTHQDDRHLPEVRQTLKRLYAVLDAVPQVR